MIRFTPSCTMCMDLNECPECDPDDPDPDCTMCGGTGECPECHGEPIEPE